MGLWRDATKNLMALFKLDSPKSKPKPPYKTSSSQHSTPPEKRPKGPPMAMSPYEEVDRRKEKLFSGIFEIMAKKNKDHPTRRKTDRTPPTPEVHTVKKPRR